MHLERSISESLERSFALYQDLAGALNAEALRSNLPNLPSNTIGGQLWCVVGARESYARGIAAGGWAGFSCSLTDAGDPAAVKDALDRSASEVKGVLTAVESFNDTQNRLLVDLLEHEAQHHGQIIRYLYGLKLAIPQSWKDRYALD
jgi:hypothetical protein